MTKMKMKSCRELVEANTEKDAKPWMNSKEMMDAIARVWIVEGLLPYGLSVLVGKPKVGKSFLALDIAVGVASGENVLGKRYCVQGGVLMLALDDTEQRLYRRLMPYRERDLSRLYFALEWPGGLEDLRLALDEHPDTRLLVIDGFAGIAPLTKRGISDALAAFKSLAEERHVAVLVVLPILHPNTAPVDTLLLLRRGFGRDEAALQVTGRDYTTKEFVLTFNPADPSRPPWIETRYIRKT
jgi:hypothetical protein